MTDSFFHVVLGPTLLGGIVIFAIIVIVYAGLTIIEFIQAMTLKHDIDWKAIISKVWTIFVALFISWYIGSWIMELYYE